MLPLLMDYSFDRCNGLILTTCHGYYVFARVRKSKSNNNACSRRINAM